MATVVVEELGVVAAEVEVTRLRSSSGRLSSKAQFPASRCSWASVRARAMLFGVGVVVAAGEITKRADPPSTRSSPP